MKALDIVDQRGQSEFRPEVPRNSEPTLTCGSLAASNSLTCSSFRSKQRSIARANNADIGGPAVNQRGTASAFPRRLIATITDGLVVRRILGHLELPSSPPAIAPARAPPGPEFAW